MKMSLPILALTMSLAPGALRAQSAREALKAGSAEFEDGAYDKAAAHFEEAASLAPKKKLDPAIAHYNRGNALFKAKNFEEARSCYEKALRTLDTDLQSKTYFKLGNLTFHSATNNTAFARYVSDLDQSMNYFMRSLLLTPDFQKAKINYEILSLKKTELLIARDTLYGVLKDAKDRVRQGEIQLALDNFKQYMDQSEVKKALSLMPKAQKDYDELLHKLQELIDVMKNAEGMSTELKAQQSALDNLQQEAGHEAR